MPAAIPPGQEVIATMEFVPRDPDFQREVEVYVEDAAGFTAEITLAVTGQPPNVAPMVKPIPANQNSVQLTLNLAANAPVGKFNVTVNGKAKHAMRDYSINAPPLPLVIKK